MAEDHAYRRIDVVGSSGRSVDDAINNAITRAGKTMRNLEWFEVEEIRGQIQDGKVARYQVAVKIGFRLDQP